MLLGLSQASMSSPLLLEVKDKKMPEACTFYCI
jgi:hypothetical protein